MSFFPLASLRRWAFSLRFIKGPGDGGSMTTAPGFFTNSSGYWSSFSSFRAGNHPIASLVSFITNGLECLQVLHAPVLDRIRSCFLGRTLIGATFVWWDFAHYAAGCLIGWLYLKRLDRKMALDACIPSNLYRNRSIRH
jgi:hypothetical protein